MFSYRNAHLCFQKDPGGGVNRESVGQWVKAPAVKDGWLTNGFVGYGKSVWRRDVILLPGKKQGGNSQPDVVGDSRLCLLS